MGFTSTSSNAKLLREIQRSLREVAVSEAGLIEATNSQIAATIASSRTDARLINVDGLNLHTETVGGHTHLITEDHARVATNYVFAEHDGASTTAVITPNEGQAIVVTDLVIAGEKRTNATIVVRFTDGTNTAGIISPVVNDDAVNLHIGFVGRYRGWRDARIEFITDTANQVATITVGYYHLRGEGVLDFATWDALR